MFPWRLWTCQTQNKFSQAASNGMNRCPEAQQINGYLMFKPSQYEGSPRHLSSTINLSLIIFYQVVMNTERKIMWSLTLKPKRFSLHSCSQTPQPAYIYIWAAYFFTFTTNHAEDHTLLYTTGDDVQKKQMPLQHHSLTIFCTDLSLTRWLLPIHVHSQLSCLPWCTLTIP